MEQKLDILHPKNRSNDTTVTHAKLDVVADQVGG